MFSALTPAIYVQISPDRLTIKNLKSGVVISEIPEMAISAPPKPRILAIGPEARGAAASQAGEVVNPFAHPRSMASDFTVAEQILKQYLRRALGHSLLKLAPAVIVHPLGSPVGGFTQVERRAFREMALGAGASKVMVWTGRVLTDQEAMTWRFPPGEGEAD